MKFLIIQTASIGDVILSTSVLEKLHSYYPDAQLDMLVKDGNQSLFKQHPFIKNLFVWIKKKHKYRNLLGLLFQIRAEQYDYVINIQRFASSGVITAFSGARHKIGFKKNPLSIFFNKRVEHKISIKPDSPHEIYRNHKLIEDITDEKVIMPQLYPTQHNYALTSAYKTHAYICIAPTSLWFTKQFPVNRWIEMIKLLPLNYYIYLLGAKADSPVCDEIISKSERNNILNLCGKLSLLESAALMQDAQMNYVNDSAPLHLACSVNAKLTAIFCSTVVEFGFSPLTENSSVVQVTENLTCRPCGLHGHKKCPQGHFKCANDIDITKLV